MEKEIKKVNQGLISSTEVLQYMFTNSYPLSPIVEDSLSNGANYMLQATYIGGMDNINYNSSTLLKCKQKYLSQLIKLEK